MKAELLMVVLGGGGHGKVLANVLARVPSMRVLGYLDAVDRGVLCGFSYLGDDNKLQSLQVAHANLGVALGMGKVTAKTDRRPLIERLMSRGLKLPPIVAPTAIVAPDVVLGEGSVIFDGAIIQPGSRIGRGCILNTGVRVDHDCVLEDDVHLAPGAILAGDVRVGASSVVGVGACCKNGVRIGTGCTIGAGAVIVSDCLEPGTYTGLPARRAP